MQSHNLPLYGARYTIQSGNVVMTETVVQRSNVLTVVGGGKGNLVDATPYRFDKVVSQPGKGWYQTKYSRYGQWHIDRWENCLSDIAPVQHTVQAVSIWDGVYNEALGRFYDKIRESELNLALSLAEIRETGKMLRDMARSIRDVKSFAIKAISHPTKSLANAWLSYQYGWRPLLNDLHSAATWSSTKYSERTVIATAKRVIRTESSGIHAFTRPWTAKSFYSYRVKLGATYRIADQAIFDRSRLTSLNPASIAWELVPYSFVVDWFYDLGGYLEGLERSLGAGLNFVRGFRSDSYLEETTGAYKTTTPYFYGNKYYTIDAPFWTKRTGMNRTVLNSFPTPNLPSFRLDLGSSQLYSAAALLRQRLP